MYYELLPCFCSLDNLDEYRDNYYTKYIFKNFDWVACLNKNKYNSLSTNKARCKEGNVI